MKLHVLTGLAWLSMGFAMAMAQQPVSLPNEIAPESTPFTAPSLTAPQVTPELWVYSQEQRRHDDPGQAVRRKAEFSATQRQARLAATRWYGFSNTRPTANVTPFMGQYSPSWVGNGWDRYDWVNGWGPSAMIYVDEITPVR